MRKELQEKIEKEIYKDQKKWFYILGGSIALFALLAILKFPVETRTINGTTTGYILMPDDTKINKKATVLLDTGKKIILDIPNPTIYQHDRKVDIMESKNIFGVPGYKFIRYGE